MEVIKEAINLNSSFKHGVKFSETDVCPKCKATITPQYIASFVYSNNGKHNDFNAFDVLNFCKHCNSTFISKYVCFDQHTSQYNYVGQFSYSEPQSFNKRVFDKDLAKLSPKFVEIYNQALQAETLGMNHICGIGYRKALEFLVKDFAIKNHPNDEEKIKSQFLQGCIQEYIDNHRIKTLAEKATWLGNDETHYIRKHIDKDVQDLKRLIDAVVYFVLQELTLDFAESIERIR